MARGSRPQPLALAFFFFFFLCIHLVPASASLRPLPRPESEDHGEVLDHPALSSSRTCWYTVQIKTSCASPARTGDAVSLAFGDAYGNEAYAARLDAGGAFARCARDTFKVGGPCGYGVCYLYLRRAGRSGWTPEWVRVYEPTSSSSAAPSTFRYGDPLPDNVWFGFNRCPRRAAAGSASSSSDAAAAAVQAM